MTKAKQSGFSLLEAIVAMVIISGAGYALFGWINSNIMALSSIRDANARAEATQNILEYMSSVNPMLKSAGNATLGRYKIRWISQPTTLVQDVKDSLYQLALYETVVKAENLQSQPWFEFKFRQVGYKRIRAPIAPP